MYPLITNDRKLTPSQVLEAHKGQPTLEKRFEQLKSVHEIAPVFLKNEARIEALFTLYFLALMVQALIERELRLMQNELRLSLEVRGMPEAQASERAQAAREEFQPRAEKRARGTLILDALADWLAGSCTREREVFLPLENHRICFGLGSVITQLCIMSWGSLCDVLPLVRR